MKGTWTAKFYAVACFELNKPKKKFLFNFCLKLHSYMILFYKVVQHIKWYCDLCRISSKWPPFPNAPIG